MIAHMVCGKRKYNSSKYNSSKYNSSKYNSSICNIIMKKGLKENGYPNGDLANIF